MPHIHRKPGDVARGVTLPCQAHVAEADRIRWDVKILSTADADQYERDLEEAYDEHRGTREKFEAVKAVVCRIVPGWDNIVDEAGVAVPFGPEALEVFNLQELYHVATQLPAAAGWGGLSKKASASPSSGAGAGSASNASGAPAGAA